MLTMMCDIEHEGDTVAKSDADAGRQMFDNEKLGHKMRGARYGAGFDKAEDFAEHLYRETGYKVFWQSIYSYERGRRTVPLGYYMAVMVALKLPHDYFYSAMPNDIAEKIRKL